MQRCSRQLSLISPPVYSQTNKYFLVNLAYKIHTLNKSHAHTHTHTHTHTRTVVLFLFCQQTFQIWINKIPHLSTTKDSYSTDIITLTSLLIGNKLTLHDNKLIQADAAIMLHLAIAVADFQVYNTHTLNAIGKTIAMETSNLLTY